MVLQLDDHRDTQFTLQSSLKCQLHVKPTHIYTYKLKSSVTFIHFYGTCSFKQSTLLFILTGILFHTAELNEESWIEACERMSGLLTIWMKQAFSTWVLSPLRSCLLVRECLGGRNKGPKISTWPQLWKAQIFKVNNNCIYLWWSVWILTLLHSVQRPHQRDNTHCHLYQLFIVWNIKRFFNGCLEIHRDL